LPLKIAILKLGTTGDWWPTSAILWRMWEWSQAIPAGSFELALDPLP